MNPQTGQVIPVASIFGTYTVNYPLSSCNCIGASSPAISSALVSILAAPVLTITGSSTVCVGQKVTYTASGASNYTWSAGATAPTLTFAPTVTATVIYTVTGKNNNGCVATKTISIKVNKCTGIEETEINSVKLEIYPNPNNGEFNISADKDISFMLISETGQIIKEIELSIKNERRIVIQGLSNGVYFLSDKKVNASSKYKIIVSN